MDRISPANLRLVVLGLGVCAVAGVAMGLNDSLRRDAPSWESGPTIAPPQAAGPPDAVAFDPKKNQPVAAPQAAPVAVKPADAKPAAPDLGEPVQTTDIMAPATTVPPPAKTAPGAKPATAKPATRPASDPVGDLVKESAPAPPPPEVPF